MIRLSAGLLALAGLILTAAGVATVVDECCGRQTAIGAGLAIIGLGLYVDTLIGGDNGSNSQTAR